MTVEQLADWIIEHRKDKVFKDYSKEQVIDELQWALENKALLVDFEGNKIFGIMVVEPRIHVRHILATEKGSMKRLVSMGYYLYPEKRITAERKGKQVVYPPKFVRKLTYV